MTERRPPGLGYESWIDRQISEAEKRGKFDDLATAGKPLPEGIKGPPVVFRPIRIESVLRERRRRRRR